MNQSQLLSSNPYDPDHKTCPKCYHRVHKSVLEHTCADSSVPRLENKPSSTAESDYALLHAEKPMEKTAYVSEAILDDGFYMAPGKWKAVDGPINIDYMKETAHYTYCDFCKEVTEWTYQPDGYYWMCKCGKVNIRNLSDFVINWPKFTPTPEPKAITIYLSGPMTGLPDFNAAEFKKYAEKYRTMGFIVKSPPELDNGDTSHPYEFYIKRDVKVLLEDGIDRIYLLPGWQKSKGANLEVHLAQMFKIPIYDTQTDELWVEDVAQEARRLVSGTRGDDYGHPLDDFGRTAGMLSYAFTHKLKEGIIFDPEDVALIQMLVKISRLINSPNHRDSGVDVIGYMLTYWMVKLERALREKRNLERVESST